MGNTMEIPGLVNIQKANWKMAIEIVDLPIDSMIIFHSYGTVYQMIVSKISVPVDDEWIVDGLWMGFNEDYESL